MIWKSNIFEKVSFLTDLPNIVLGVHWKRCWGSGVGGRGGEMVMYWTYKIHYYLVWKVICYCVRSIEDNFLCRYFFCFVYFFFFCIFFLGLFLLGFAILCCLNLPLKTSLSFLTLDEESSGLVTCSRWLAKVQWALF